LHVAPYRESRKHDLLPTTFGNLRAPYPLSLASTAGRKGRGNSSLAENKRPDAKTLLKDGVAVLADVSTDQRSLSAANMNPRAQI
jgi:hypothetical protein